jgi:hypothetical protein
MNNQLAVQNQIAMTDMERMAQSIAKSGLFGMKNADQAIALMIVAQSEGRHPGSVAKEYHIIQGRPALRSDAMLARFQASGGSVKWGERTDKSVTGTFSHAQGGDLTLTWTIDDAKRAGIYGNQWLKYPRQMLTARVISEGVRAVFPAVVAGVYTPEEVQDFDAPTKSSKESSHGGLIEPFKNAETIKTLIAKAPNNVEIVSSVSLDELPDAEWGSEDHSWADDFESKIFEIANDVTLFLRHKGLITTEQTWRDLPEGAYRERLTRNPDKFIEAVKAFTK